MAAALDGRTSALSCVEEGEKPVAVAEEEEEGREGGGLVFGCRGGRKREGCGNYCVWLDHEIKGENRECGRHLLRKEGTIFCHIFSFFEETRMYSLLLCCRGNKNRIIIKLVFFLSFFSFLLPLY